VAQRDTIVVGASAGGVEALRELISSLPSDLPATVLVVLHTPPTAGNALASILSRAGSLTVLPADQESPLKPGVVLVARPDHHLVVVDGRVILTRGPRENGHRPAVDVLFRSAARALGPRVIGVVLSGTLDDGSAGLVAVRNRGGIGLVQDPQEALHAGMPTNAIRAAQPEYILRVAEMAEVIQRLIGVEVEDPPAPSKLMETEVALAELDLDALQDPTRPGVAAGLSCPDCHGTLFLIDDDGYSRYRCRVGHAWSAESLLAENDAALEGALWMALRSLEEKAALASSMAEQAVLQERSYSSRRFRDHADEAWSAAEMIRRMLLRGDGSADHTHDESQETEAGLDD
jgi:two-component system chemotaxis response regulator CheB